MNQLNAKRLVFVSLLSLLLVPGAASADPTIAQVENFGDTLVFHPVVEFAKLRLTVTGPCNFVFEQTIDQGEPFFRLDETTIDGTYTYDLVRIEAVDPAVIKILKQARAVGDEETPNQLCRDGKLPAAPIAQSGGFTVSFGKIIFDDRAFEKGAGMPADVDHLLGDPLPVASKGPAPSRPPVPTKDFVINDDLIVDGSACIGFDCVNGEVFSFDTIRLKENNLRIKFDDTSVAASFPSNDWQLTANESANGGASKFSIEDVTGGRTPFTVEANARSHSLYVDDGGRIGSRTSTPSVEIHTIDGDTPTLRLQQDGSSGFEPQTWDVAGNETNFFIRDVTNGSALPFRIRPGAPSSAVFIDVDGDVGVGTSSPSAEVHVRRTDATRTEIRAENTNATAQAAAFRMINAAHDWEFQADTAGNVLFRDVTQNSNPLVIEPNITNETIRVDSGNGGRVGIRTGNNVNFTLEVNGTIGVTGTGQVHPDYVFEPDYELESIDEHASYMFENKHLPAVGAGKYDDQGRAVIELTARSQGMLEELEKAHIYIAQLHDRLKSKEDELSHLKEEMAALTEAVRTLVEQRP